MYFTFVSVDTQSIISFDVFLLIDKWAKSDNIQFAIKFARVKFFPGMCFSGQRIVQPTMSSPPFSQKTNLEVILSNVNSSK